MLSNTASFTTFNPFYKLSILIKGSVTSRRGEIRPGAKLHPGVEFFYDTRGFSTGVKYHHFRPGVKCFEHAFLQDNFVEYRLLSFYMFMLEWRDGSRQEKVDNIFVNFINCFDHKYFVTTTLFITSHYFSCCKNYKWTTMNNVHSYSRGVQFINSAL